MVVVYCVISFILGWRLSTWAKSEPFSAARRVYQERAMAGAGPGVSGENLSPPPQLPDAEQLQAEQLTTLDDDDDQSGAWFFDGTYLHEEGDDVHNDIHADAAAQAEKYFIDNFKDEGQLLSQRLTALKAALSMDAKVLDEEGLTEDVYQLLLKEVDETQHPDDIVYLLTLMQGRICSERLPGLAIFLKSGVAAVREEALRAIAPADCHGAYRKYVEYILNNDPQSEVRALAFEMLEQYYGHSADKAA